MKLINTHRHNEEKRAHWEGIIQAWKQSGKSRIQYCEENNLKISTFGYWQKRSRKQKNLLVPVKVLESKPIDPVILRIETPLGIKIFVPSFANATELKEIFKLLGVIQ